MAKSFTSVVDSWCKKVEAQTLETFKDSARTLVQDVRQAVTHDTGNLSRSVVLAPDSNIPAGAPDEVFPDPAANDEAVLSGVQLGDKIGLGVRAAYAAKQNFGYQSNGKEGVKVHPGNFAVTTAVSKWNEIVRRAAKKNGLKAK